MSTIERAIGAGSRWLQVDVWLFDAIRKHLSEALRSSLRQSRVCSTNDKTQRIGPNSAVGVGLRWPPAYDRYRGLVQGLVGISFATAEPLWPSMP